MLCLRRTLKFKNPNFRETFGQNLPKKVKEQLGFVNLFIRISYEETFDVKSIDCDIMLVLCPLPIPHDYQYSH